MGMNDKTKIISVLYKHFVGNSDAADEDLLKEWLAQHAENRKIFDRLNTNETFRHDFLHMRPSEIDIQRTVDHVLGKNKAMPENKPLKVFAGIKRYLPYAAVLAIALSIGYYWRIDTGNETPNSLVKVEDVLGGDKNAFLRLSNGQRLELKNQTRGLVTGETGLQYDDGTLVLTNELAGAVEDYELNTPKGSTYQITLSDGTKVWLNADSKLSYPNYFTGDRRIVNLDGEAYFEVSKAKKPFIVKTAQQEVEVLGTIFNINAYGDELQTSTTLLEGSVVVTHEATREQRKLLPGQQALATARKIRVQNKDVQDVVAWKSGKFSFEGKSFKQVMNELARWYDLKIVYKGDIPEMTFFGDAYRSNNLGIVLGALQSAEIAYEMKEDRILVITGKKGGNHK